MLASMASCDAYPFLRLILGTTEPFILGCPSARYLLGN